MHHLRSLIFVSYLVGYGSALSLPTQARSTPYHNEGLNVAAKAAGKLWFGTATNIPGIEQYDRNYLEQLLNWKDFGAATPANRMKFAFTEQRQGQFNLTEAEIFMNTVNPSNHTRKRIRCHPLIWHQTLPNWLTEPSTPWTNETLAAVLVNHVQYLVSYFGDRCTHWDVVNEAFSESPDSDRAFPYRSVDNIWYQIIGPEYVVMAFKAASVVVREQGLGVKLYYNDYGIESPGAKTNSTIDLVRGLQARGIQIDGVGFESHFSADGAPNQTRQEQAMTSFTALGIDVAVTELDVRIPVPITAANEKKQAQTYYDTVAACMNVRRCMGVTVWDFVDSYSWVPNSFDEYGSALLWAQPGGNGTALARKNNLYDVVMQALTGRPFLWSA